MCPLTPLYARTHNDYVPLVDEIWLKRPDLYGLNSHYLHGSAYLEGSRSTPLATPLLGRQNGMRDGNARSETNATLLANASTHGGEERAADVNSSSSSNWDQHDSTVGAPAIQGSFKRRDAAEGALLQSTHQLAPFEDALLKSIHPLAPLSQNPQVRDDTQPTLWSSNCPGRGLREPGLPSSPV